MAMNRLNIDQVFRTFSTLPRVNWQAGRRYDPQVVGVLQNNGFSEREAINIASDRNVRTFSGRLIRGGELFRLGVGTDAMRELEMSGLLYVRPERMSLPTWAEILRPYIPCLSPVGISGSYPIVRSDLPSGRFMMMSEDSGHATDVSAAASSSIIIPTHITDNLRTARTLYSQERHDEARPLIENTLEHILNIISGGVDPLDPILSYYYAVKLMSKFLGVSSNYMSPPPSRSVVQVLVLDSAGERVLLQRRGRFKRMDPGCYSVSANAKLKAGGKISDAVANAVLDEVGIAIDPGRLELIGNRDQYGNHLTSFSFFAISPEEASQLANIHQQLAPRYCDAHDIALQYDENTRCLTVYTINSDTLRQALDEVVGRINGSTGIPPVFSFTNTDTNSLMVYRLNENEEETVSEIIGQKDQKITNAASRLAGGADQQTLKDLDSDGMEFVPWVRARCDSITGPQRFAQVLTDPYLPNDDVWRAMGYSFPEVVNIDAPIAQHTCVSGGKGSNMHILREILRDEPGVIVPETSELTSFVYEQYVLGNPEIRANIELLDKETDPEKANIIAARIREQILAIEFPETLNAQIESEFTRLGSDTAERSSATASEDTEKHQAAGQAKTKLHQINVTDAIAGTKAVLASLFNDGFVTYRRSIGVSSLSDRMVVLLQTFHDPIAAGVIYSFDQSTGRPVYRISAQPGVGEGVVEGKGLADSWLVGSLCDFVLGRNIPRKTVRFVADPNGGVREEAIDMTEASIDDATVLRLATVAKKIHTYYRENGLADDVDIEYCIDHNNNIVILQTRAKTLQATTTADGTKVIKVKTVDESQVPPDTTVLNLDEHSMIAVQGATASIIQTDPDRKPAECLPGRILVTNHTNNDYNAVFGGLNGVITTDGDQTSHAAQHAYEKKIPCVVGSNGALDLLMPFDGMEATLDAGRRRVYLGHMPIIEVERALNVWLTDDNEIAGFTDNGSRHENIRPWEFSRSKKPKVFVEDFEFHCRRRSNLYTYFHLDYFYRAWDRLTARLNDMYADRAPWVLKPQGRQIKAIDDRHQLVHVVEDNDPGSIFYFLMGVRDFGTPDLQDLFDARLGGFRDFAAFTNTIKQINRTNVESVVEHFIDVFSWMHFGFWLDSVVEEFAFRQLRYISNEGSLHNVLRDEAVADMPRDFWVDPLNPAIPAGRLLNLSREKEKEIYALMETVRSEPALQNAFLGDSASVRTILATQHPDILAVIDDWSMRYKMTLEDLDVLSDTDEYLGDLRTKLLNNTAMSQEMLSNVYHAYLDVQGHENASLDTIRQTDPNLYLLLRSQARCIVASGQTVARSKIPAGELQRLEDLFEDPNADILVFKPNVSDEQIDKLGIRSETREILRQAQMKIAPCDVTDQEIDAALPRVITRLNEINDSYRSIRGAAADILHNYPEIKQVLMVSKLQFPLREDAHHLIVPNQRRMARMMIESARPFVPSVLQRPEEVFNIGMDDYIALLSEPDPGFVGLTLKRWPLLLQAEIDLKSCWTVKKSDLAGITPDLDGLWKSLSTENKGAGYLDMRGFLQDKFRTMTSADLMKLDPKFEPYREQIFRALKAPLERLPQALDQFEAATDQAVGMLEIQYESATIPRVKESYSAEQIRLKQRVADLRAKMEQEIH